MTMANDWKDYWDLVGSDKYGNETYSTKDVDDVCSQHMPVYSKRSSMSLCIGLEKTWKWLGTEWVEM